MPWLFWRWCYADCLEITCKDGFSSYIFSTIQEMLLQLYYMYICEVSEKVWELDNIVSDLKQAFNIAEGGNHLIRSC